MKKWMKKLIIYVIIYLIVSSMYIGVHINFNKPIYYENQEKVPNFYNIFRFVMGIPPVDRGYEGVSPRFWLQIIRKITLAIILVIILIIYSVKIRKDANVELEKRITKSKKIVKIIRIIIKGIFIILITLLFLIYLYIIYWRIHGIR